MDAEARDLALRYPVTDAEMEGRGGGRADAEASQDQAELAKARRLTATGPGRRTGTGARIRAELGGSRLDASAPRWTSSSSRTRSGQRNALR